MYDNTTFRVKRLYLQLFPDNSQSRCFEIKKIATAHVAHLSCTTLLTVSNERRVEGTIRGINGFSLLVNPFDK